MWKELSDELVQTSKVLGPRLFHIGGEGLPYRTGLWWSDSVGVTLAREAQAGDEVTLTDQRGQQIVTVQAFDPATGIVVVGGKGVAGGWQHAEAQLASLALTLAYPSPEGLEARLDLVRLVSKEYLQTDGMAYPGFAGAAVLNPEGGLVGMVFENDSGNRGTIFPGARLFSIVESLLRHGSPKTRVLGVRVNALHDEQNGPGLLVVEADSEGPARLAGIVPGDILTSINGQALKYPPDLSQNLQGTSGDVAVSLKRGGQTLTLQVKPAERLETWRRRHRG